MYQVKETAIKDLSLASSSRKSEEPNRRMIIDGVTISTWQGMADKRQNTCVYF